LGTVVVVVGATVVVVVLDVVVVVGTAPATTTRVVADTERLPSKATSWNTTVFGVGAEFRPIKG
jgi:hypothetical protein